MSTTDKSLGRGTARVRVYDDGELKREFYAKNTMTKSLHEHVVTMMDPDSTDSSRKTVTHLAVGNDDTTAVGYTDTSLNNEIGRFGIADYDQQENDAFTSTFISSTELVGEDIKECGLYTAASGGTLLNHFVFADADQITGKTSSETVVIDVILQWRAA